MVTITFLFWFLVIMFGFIGAMRGWAKELLVTFSVILALAFITLTETYIPFLDPETASKEFIFWFNTIVLGILVFFGYQTVHFSRFEPKARREHLSDSLLGFFLGAINGYLIFGSILYYVAQANYPFDVIKAPVPGTPEGDAALNLIQYLPPAMITEPWIYFAVILAFIFVIIVFI
jgi:uncharacterized membrane protein required for colicin V production